MSFPRFEKALEVLKQTHRHKYIDQDWLKLDRVLEHAVYDKIAQPGRSKDHRSKVAYGPDFHMVKAVDRRSLGGPLVPEGSSQNFSKREKMVMAKRAKPSVCEVCDRHHAKICWDHDHRTGNFRGWLCSDCNTALGLAGDCAERLRKLADYLDNQPGNKARTA